MSITPEFDASEDEPSPPASKTPTHPSNPSDNDLLSTLCERAGLNEAEISDLVAWLSRDVEHDAYARLEQAGDSNKPDRISLAQVFIDLEISDSTQLDDGSKQRGVGQRFIQYFNVPREERLEQFRREYPGFSARPAMADERERVPASSIEAYLLIGGPGQGKSTLGQLLCQLHRARLLLPRVELLSDPKKQEIVKAFANAQSHKELGNPAETLFPLRIVLANAAAYLATWDNAPESEQTPMPRLLCFVEQEIHKRQPESRLKASHLLALLRAHPWLLVLDGWDEVPVAADRQSLLKAMDELLAEISCQRESLLIATTRPQGYAGELKRPAQDFKTLYLAPLSEERILAYIQRLVDSRFSSDRREIVRDRLLSAQNSDTTRRLMQSPLQVTIMATLVDRIGRAPQERWSLFREYYRVIYEREMERPIQAAQLLRDYKNYVDKIHYQTGLLLQTQAEQSGGTSALITPQRFEEIINAILEDDEMDGQQREKLCKALSRAAKERLVLLVEPQPECIGFEIRSIQEFMAACAIAQKDDVLLQKKRISQIAKAGGFRNTLLFLAGKAFSDLSDLRDAFCDEIIPALNSDKEDAVLSTLRAGSVLALEILEEGSVLKQQKYVRKLYAYALQLLDLPPCREHLRLLRAIWVDEDARRVALPLLLKAMGETLEAEGDCKAKRSLWIPLLSLVDLGEREAMEMAERHWPRHVKMASDILGALHISEAPIGAWILHEALNSLEHIHVQSIINLAFAKGIDRESVPPAFQALWRFYTGEHSIGMRLGIGEHALGFYLNIISFKQEGHSLPQNDSIQWRALASIESAHRSWLPHVAAAKLIDGGDKNTLAAQLERLSKDFDVDLFDYAAYQLPWPLAACLGSARSAEELRGFARLAKEGALGDREDWLQAEARWAEQRTFDLASLAMLKESSLPFDTSIAHQGLPVHANGFGIHLNVDRSNKALDALISLWRSISNPIPRIFLMDLLVKWAHGHTNEFSTSLPLRPEDVDAYWALNAKRANLDILHAYQIWKDPPEVWLDRLDRLGRSHQVFANYTWYAPDTQLGDYISSLFKQNPKHIGLLPILALLSVMDEETPIPPDLLQPLTQWEDAYFRDAAFLLLLAQGYMDPSQVAEEAKNRAQAPDQKFWTTLDLLDVIENHFPPESPLYEPTLLALAQHLPPNQWSETRQALGLLQKALPSRISGLADTHIWERLKFPLPKPDLHHTPDSSPELDRLPPRIESITLHNFRCFERFTLTPIPPELAADSELGQWIVLLGDNGTGKSTFLRGLLFALIDLNRQGILPSSVLGAPYRRYGMGENEECSVRVKRYAQTKDYEVKLVVQYSQEVFVPYDGPKAPPFLFGYGAQRGSALGGAKRSVNFDPGAPVATLLDEGANLVHAETWLLLRAYDAMDNRGKEPEILWNTIKNVMLKLLPGVEQIEVKERRLWLSGPKIGTAVLSAMSDGYLTTLGWTVDMIARWIDLMERRKEKIAPDFHQTMSGLVLIDELDLHLHPEWQRHIIRDIRETFPRMSFVATTHNPLCLLGARAEEIWTLRRNEEGKIVAEHGKQLPALMTAAQILKHYFGINRTFPDPLGEKLQRLSFLMGSGERSPAEEQKMYQLVRELRKEKADPGWIALPEDKQNGSGR